MGVYIAPLHARQAPVCKCLTNKPLVFDSSGCKDRKNCSDEFHTSGPDCRHVLTSQRHRATQRHPYGHPAHDEPTAGLRAASAAKQSKRRKSKLSGDSLLNLMEVGNLIRVQRKTCRHHRLWSSGDTALIRTRVSSRANSCAF